MGKQSKSRKPANDGFSAPVQAKSAKNSKADRAAKSKTGIAVVCMVLVLALCLGVIVWTKIVDNGYFYRSTVSVKSENYEVNNAMMSYFFNSQYQQMASTLEQMGVDLSVNLKDQDYTSNLSWYDYLMQNVTVPQVENILVLCEAAKVAGFELTEHDMEHIDEAIASIEEMAETYSDQYGGKENYYIRNIYGYGINLDDIRDAIELNQLAAAYSEHLAETYVYTEDEWNAYLEEHRSDFLVIDYVSYTFEAEEEETEEETETVADTTAADTVASDTTAADTTAVDTTVADTTAADTTADETATDTTAEEEEEELSPEKQAALNQAYALAQKLMDDEANALEIFNSEVKAHLENVVYADEEDADAKAESVQSALDATVATAVANDATNEFLAYAFGDEYDGNVRVVHDDDNGQYTVYLITKTPYIEEYTTKNVRMIALSAADGEDIAAISETALAEFEEAGKTEDAFAEVAIKYSHDSAAHENGGLYENQGNGDLGVEELDAWLYDSARVSGDYTTVSNGLEGEEEIIYIAYYVGDGLIKWQRDVDSAMVDEAYAEEYEKLAETHTVEVDYNELYKIPSQAGL